MLTLFLAPGASSMAVHVALHEIGTAFEARPLSFRREHRCPAYLALNPDGKVPTLLVDGRPLTEVAAILFYLARRFPDAGLLPEDTEAEAQALDHAVSVWKIVEARIAGAGWVLGRYSVADIHLFRLFWRFNASLRPEPGAFPNLAAHHGRTLARPAVRRTIGIQAAVGYELPA